MHGPATVARCVALGDQGLSATQIARLTGLSRRTVSDWLCGYTPRRANSARAADCALCGQGEHDYQALPRQYAYLLGIYLGDGCISLHPRGVYRLRIALDTAYPGIVDEVAEAVSVVMPANRVGRVQRPYNCVDLSSYSRAWPCLFPQHGAGKKHERRISLRAWQWLLVEDNPELLLRGLIHSDGCRFINTGRRWRHPRYAFENRSADIRRIFCDACDLLDLRWTRATYTIYVSRKADVARMDEFIGPKA
jgi:hypothetical protein